MLKIGFDAKRLFHNFTGLGNYSRTLLHNLALQFPQNEFHLYSPPTKKKATTASFFDNTDYQLHFFKNRGSNYWRTFGVKKDLKKSGIQIFHGLSNEIPLGISQIGVKSIVTIHDLIFKKYPRYYSLLDRKIYDAKFRYACKNADIVIAASEHTKRDIAHYYNIPLSKIRVIYQTCNKVFHQEFSPKQAAQFFKKYELPPQYLLYAGAIIERKNLLGIIKALEILPENLRIPLIVVGKGKGYEAKVRRCLARKKLKKCVHFLAEIGLEELAMLYQNAQVFLYPSFYEGFGIPIIEAMFSKTPVLTSPLSSLPEVAGKGALFAAPDKPEQIADGIDKILTNSDLREKLIENGWKHVQKFRAEKVTREVMDLYENA